MRRFACRNFQITTTADSKLSYTPCYMQCGFIAEILIRRTEPFCFIFVGGNLKFEYLYIKKIMSQEMRKYIDTFREKMLKESVSKKDITTINTIDDFINVVNNLEKTPQRGFSYKPNSAIKLPTNTLLFHSTTKENIASILQNGFRGVGAYYSSFTKTRKSKEQIVDGNFGFAFDLTNKKIDSRYQKDFLYGGWGIVFKSRDACKVYNTGDKQFQVVFDVTKNIDVVCVVNVKIDANNTKEWVWDIYDENLILIESDVKLSTFLKSVGKK